MTDVTDHRPAPSLAALRLIAALSNGQRSAIVRMANAGCEPAAIAAKVRTAARVVAAFLATRDIDRAGHYLGVSSAERTARRSIAAGPAALSTSCRSTIVRMHNMGRAAADIATVLGVSVSAVSDYVATRMTDADGRIVPFHVERSARIATLHRKAVDAPVVVARAVMDGVSEKSMRPDVIVMTDRGGKPISMPRVRWLERPDPWATDSARLAEAA